MASAGPSVSTSSAPAAPLPKECGICKDSHDVILNVTNGQCRHGFCGECLGHLLKHALNPADGDFETLRCPSCKAESPKPTREQVDRSLFVLDIGQLRQYVDEDTQRRLEEQRVLKALRDLGVSVVSCPECKTVGSYDHRRGNSQVRCLLISCARTFCASCGVLWHTDQTCAEYRASLRPDDPANIALIGRTTKPCPFCAARTSHWRDHACHHIRPVTGCPSCKRHWCYGCGQAWAPGHRCFVGSACSALCDCRPCPDCKPGVRCDQCTGCAVCALPRRRQQ